MNKLRNSILVAVALLTTLVAIVATAPPDKRNAVVILPAPATAVERGVTQEPIVKIVNPAMIFREINGYDAMSAVFSADPFRTVLPGQSNRNRIRCPFKTRPPLVV